VVALAVVLFWEMVLAPDRPRTASRAGTPLDGGLLSGPRRLAAGRRLTVWWDGLAEPVRGRVVRSGQGSNVAPADYVGPAACKECHKKNHASWSGHPHRWMNALAGDDTVKGDFSGTSISYRGGQASFTREAGRFLMRLTRGRAPGGSRRTYEVHQTIGRRFFQYYVGKQVEGPEASDHVFATRDHVLPFGYWLDRKEWVPVVHIGPEVADEKRPDPFAPPDRPPYYADYATSCNYCHTTFPLGDLFGRRPHQIGEHAPLKMHWSMRPYLEESHPEEARAIGRFLPAEQAVQDLARGPAVQNPMLDWEAPKYAVTLGVSCEACHLGAREHVASAGKVPPRFFPASPHLHVEAKSPEALDFGRGHANVNWACGRCHTGTRPTFAAGMSTWNSVEYDDAMRGSCYSKLRCIDCHNPHEGIGPRWAHSADSDDAKCLKCHDKFRPAKERLEHTHHPAGSEGARCMSCHMPRINEGLQDMVRTHMIYSPTRADMIQAGHPNACNLCHTDRPIDWALRYLKEWYGASYDEKQIAANYPDRGAPVGVGWLRSRNPAVRLVATAALARARDVKALPQLLDALDDSHLVNRQFADQGLHEMLNLRLADFGYRFYMTSQERRRPLAALRAHVLRPCEAARR
jgi:hypothetical protein